MWMAVLAFVASAIFVDLVGYWLHRWAHSPTSPLNRAHETHHRKYPYRNFLSDGYRSAGSDSLAIWFAPFGIAYAATILLAGVPHPAAILIGGGLVALASSVVHDLTHIRGSMAWRWRVLRRIARRHRIHHSRTDTHFGVLSGVWDRLFRTAR